MELNNVFTLFSVLLIMYNYYAVPAYLVLNYYLCQDQSDSDLESLIGNAVKHLLLQSATKISNKIKYVFLSTK